MLTFFLLQLDSEYLQVFVNQQYTFYNTAINVAQNINIILYLYNLNAIFALDFSCLLSFFFHN